MLCLQHWREVTYRPSTLIPKSRNCVILFRSFDALVMKVLIRGLESANEREKENATNNNSRDFEKFSMLKFMWGSLDVCCITQSFICLTIHRHLNKETHSACFLRKCSTKHRRDVAGIDFFSVDVMLITFLRKFNVRPSEQFHSISLNAFRVISCNVHLFWNIQCQKATKEKKAFA